MSPTKALFFWCVFPYCSTSYHARQLTGRKSSHFAFYMHNVHNLMFHMESIKHSVNSYDFDFAKAGERTRACVNVFIEHCSMNEPPGLHGLPQHLPHLRQHSKKDPTTTTIDTNSATTTTKAMITAATGCAPPSQPPPGGCAPIWGLSH